MTKSTDESDLARIAEILASEARRALDGGPTGHPELDELAAYLAGELGTEQEDAMRAHLVACRECTRRLLDLEPMSQPEIVIRSGPETTGPEAPVDFAKVAAWRDLSRRREDQRRWPLRTWGALAAMLLVSVALAFLLAPHLGVPAGGANQGVQANLPIHYLDELTRSRSAEESLIEVDAAARYWVLILTPPLGAEGEFSRYSVELTDGAGKVLLRTDDLVASDHGALRLGISHDLVPEGAATLRLSGVDGEQRVELESYPLRIHYR